MGIFGISIWQQAWTELLYFYEPNTDIYASEMSQVCT